MDTMKPKLKANELVDKMRSNGITFDIITQDQAESYLSEHSNYYRLASYRKNYDKFLHGSQMGKYMSLDFAYLAELSTIDMHLRYLVIKYN